VKIKNYKQIFEDIDNKVYHPVYVLYGEEPYYIDIISNYIENNILSETEKEFNFTVLYGKDTNVQNIISIVKRFPMMANYQVVILKESQHLDKIEELESYIINPVKTTIFVICYKYKKFDNRTKFAKIIQENSILFESNKLYEDQIINWIYEYLKEKKLNITPHACSLIAEYLGNNLSSIANELNKLAINIKEGETITENIVEQHIGISREFNVFELQNALAERNKFKSFRIVHYFTANIKENPIPKIAPMLFDFFVKVMITHTIIKKNNASDREIASEIKVNPYYIKNYKIASKKYTENQLKQIFGILREYDLKSKGVQNTEIYADDSELMKEMIYKIINI